MQTLALMSDEISGKAVKAATDMEGINDILPLIPGGPYALIDDPDSVMQYLKPLLREIANKGETEHLELVLIADGDAGLLEGENVDDKLAVASARLYSLTKKSPVNVHDTLAVYREEEGRVRIIREMGF